MSKKKRFCTINTFGSPMCDYERVVNNVNYESVTDKSHFVPTAELVKTVGNITNTTDEYDFPNGVDNGKSLPIGRKKGVDISEVYQAVKTQNDKLKTEVNKAVEKQKVLQQVEQLNSSTQK